MSFIDPIKVPETKAPIEVKVIASTAGFFGSSALATFIIWLLGAGLWDAGWGAEQAGDAIGAVPAPVSALILLVLGAAGTFAAGYAAPHTRREV